MFVGVSLGVFVGVSVFVGVCVIVPVGVCVGVAVFVGVVVGVNPILTEGVGVWVWVGVGVGVPVFVGVGVLGPTEHKGLSTTWELLSNTKQNPVPSANIALGSTTTDNKLSWYKIPELANVSVNEEDKEYTVAGYVSWHASSLVKPEKTLSK